MKEQNWKDTLLMPKTDFSMKAGLVEKEPQYRKKWLDNKIYQKVLDQNRDNKAFVLHDGPPYANGNLHVGHALNKILKDIIVRRKSLEGFYSPFTPGWDTHGLPIENKMLEELKMTKDDLDKVSLRKKAAAYANKQVVNQMEQFKKMQLFTDFSKIYKTLDKEFEVGQLMLFKKMALERIIYKGLKPVYWSPSSQSALAEAEVEYKDIRSPQIIVSMRVNKGTSKIQKGDCLLIMTTTPWTLPANAGIAVGTKYKYVRLQVNHEIFIIANDLVESVAELAKWDDYKIVDTFLGSDIVGATYKSIISEEVSPVIAGHHVTTDAGTGLVHMAPLFGEDDYVIGKEENLKMIMHVDDKGVLNSDAGKYAGMFFEDANKEIGMDIDTKQQLISLKFVKHSYPHDWRTHKPVIYRGVPQWFVNIDKIKKQILASLETVRSYPSWGIKRISKMIEDRNEWTISRQRTWGVPIIIFYDEDNNPVIDEKIFDHVISMVKEHGSDVWWEKDVDELLPEKYKGKNFTKEKDIMDVWFDSGSSNISVFPGDKQPPFDLYIEGNDQFRGWFNSSLINSVAYRGIAPYKTLVSHGYVLDGKQQKMSKSKGNVIDPLEIIEKHGADILRLWVANSEYTSDVTISQEILKQVIEIYRRIRNTFKFMLGNIGDFDYQKHNVELKDMHKFIYEQTQNFEKRISQYYNNYKFLDVVKEVNKFFIDLSGWYFDYAKDSLYADDRNSIERRSIQTNIFHVINISLHALAAIIPTTIEEVYEYIPNIEKKESFFLNRRTYNQEIIKYNHSQMAFFEQYKNEANKALEKARADGLIKRNDEAVLTVSIPNEHRFVSEEIFANYLMVSKVIFGDKFIVATLKEPEKCPRCWKVYEKHALNQDNLCKRCHKIIKNVYNETHFSL